MKNIFDRFSPLFFAAALLICAAFAHSQVPVAIAPPLHPKFSDNSGNVLASGFLYSYQAGTTTLLNTYVDSTGTIQNPDPIPLDATGAPSNGSTQTGIWLANSAYKFCAYNAALVQQWCVDNVTGYLGLLNTANAWTFQQTFSLPIIDLSIDNQMVFGTPGNQTTLDFPPPSANIVLHFPNVAGTVLTGNSPNITTPTFNGTNCPIVNGPGTYVCIANANPTGTTLNNLVKLMNAPSQATITGVLDTGGILGVCVASCGNTGTATIQQSGITSCFFANGSVAGDYVTNSTGTAGSCADVSATFPLTTQALGRVLTTVGAGGTASIDLFGPEVRNPFLGGSPGQAIVANGLGNAGFSNANGPTAVASVAAGPAAGGGGTAACAAIIICRDSGGEVFVTTATASTGALIIVTFGASHGSMFCTISPANANAAALSGATQVILGVSLPATYNFTINAGSTPLANTTQYIWYYTCTFS